MTLFDRPVIVTSIMVQHLDYSEKKTVSVTGRPYHSLTFREKGSITVEKNGQKLLSNSGDLTFVPQDFSYDTRILEDGSMYIAHFTVQDSHHDLVPQIVTPSCPAAFKSYFAELGCRFRIGNDKDAECLSIFYRILAEAKAEYERQSVSKFISPRMRQAKSRIDDDFGNPSLSVGMLAAELGISETYFRREFRNSFGCSPSSYLKKVRLENAKLLLSTGYCGITKAAMQCGFDSVSYFSYEFHRYTGIMPSKYIKRK